ncbi:TPA: MFS transporter [Enterobacter cloacae]|nr:MFS transporter [Enterobacter cloacae]
MMGELKATLRDAALQRIWSAVLVSTLGNFLLMLSLSVYVWRQTGSNFLASAIFAVQWGAIIFSAPLVSRILQRYPAARTAAFSEWAGGIISLLIGLSISFLPMVFFLLLLRGFAESLSKSARVVAMKEAVPTPLLGRAASLLGTSTFIGIALGSLGGALLVDSIAPGWIAVIDSLTFVISGMLYLSLWRRTPVTDQRPAERKGGMRAALQTLRGWPDLRRQFVWVLVSTAFLQGFHNVARTLLPLQLGMGEQGIMLLQALASASFFFGAMAVALLMQGESRNWRSQPWFISLLSAALLQFSLLVPSMTASLVSYALYLFVFEIAFTFCQKNMIVLCPQEYLGAISSAAISASTLGMVAVIAVGGALSDWVGLAATGWIFCALFLAVLLWVEIPPRLVKGTVTVREEAE